MRHLLIAFPFLCLHFISYAQGNGFPYGQATYRELDIKNYDKDTAAVALILDEFGEAYVDNDNDNNLIFEYHTKIKILKKGGLSQANFQIFLRKNDSRIEKILTVKASSFNVENGSIREMKLDSKNIFSEDINKNYNAKKFAIPNVQVGSVIEVFYKLESPFFYNFRSWEFQCDIPKINSEFWCLIPANYVYNISLRGFQTLSKNESSIVKDCFSGGRADCTRLKYGMKNIPAFQEEEFMTAKSNFLSVLNFELSEIKYFDGRTNKITKEWKDADEEMRRSVDFGLQIKRGKDIVDNQVEQIIIGETNELLKAQKIYDFIKGWYRWNDVYGKYSEFGIKKAFESKTGNVGDINLSLIAALKFANLNVEPMLLSTRDNGLATELYPVLSEFNYVVAKLNINDKVYLLDATDDFHPFGLIPVRCLNGKGRVLGDKESYWYDIKPSDKEKTLSVITLVLGKDGLIRGSIQYSYLGYDAVLERKKINKFRSQQEYIDHVANSLNSVTIKKFQIENSEDLKKPVVVKLEVEIEGYDSLNSNNFLFNPFFIEPLKTNSFRSSERLYPVDFGAPREKIMIFSLEYPSEYEIDGIPPKVGLTLPQNGGRYIFEIQNAANKLTVNNSLLIAKPVFTSNEYHFVKELFNRVIAVQQTELVFKKRK